jgi:hypothetical protein
MWVNVKERQWRYDDDEVGEDNVRRGEVSNWVRTLRDFDGGNISGLTAMIGYKISS